MKSPPDADLLYLSATVTTCIFAVSYAVVWQYDVTPNKRGTVLSRTFKGCHGRPSVRLLFPQETTQLSPSIT